MYCKPGDAACIVQRWKHNRPRRNIHTTLRTIRPTVEPGNNRETPDSDATLVGHAAHERIGGLCTTDKMAPTCSQPCFPRCAVAKTDGAARCQTPKGTRDCERDDPRAPQLRSSQQASTPPRMRLRRSPNPQSHRRTDVRLLARLGPAATVFTFDAFLGIGDCDPTVFPVVDTPPSPKSTQTQPRLISPPPVSRRCTARKPPLPLPPSNEDANAGSASEDNQRLPYATSPRAQFPNEEHQNERSAGRQHALPYNVKNSRAHFVRPRS